MKAQVQLPNDQLIDYWYFCKAIAEGICPAGEKDLRGIDCIVGKQITVCLMSAAPVPSVMFVDGLNVLNQPNLVRTDVTEQSIHHSASDAMFDQQVEELSLPYKLTGEDRQLMEKLLLELPTLHYPLSDKDVTDFMGAYTALPNRPMWVPVLVTEETIKRRKVRQEMIMLQHEKSLQEEVTKGRLVAVNGVNVPVTRLFMGDLIPRAQAIAYLERCGIQYADSTSGNGEKENPETARPSSNTTCGIKNKLTEAQREELVFEHQKLLLSGERKATKKTADKFEVSTRHVRNLVGKAKIKMTPNNVSQAWLRKR